MTADWPVYEFARPGGIVQQEVDAWSGMRPTRWTREVVTENFIEGTVPGEDTTKRGLDVIVDEEGNEYRWHEGCAGTPERRGFLVLDDVEADRPDWREAIDEWIERAKRGPGVAGGPDPEVRTRTSYIFTPDYTPYGRSWGAPFPPSADCDEAPSPSPSPSPEPTESPSPEPTESPTPEPTVEPTPTPTTPPPPEPPEPPVPEPPGEDE